jgi:D-arabinose 1-dehydrogenase-like Zn-dependent alcohol dehydrogenase
MKTTAISTSEDKREDAISYGAIDFINSNNKEDLKKNMWRFDLMLVTANAGTSA